MATRFKVDENLPREAQALLLSAGHEAETVHEEHFAGHPDATVFDVCLTEDRVLITLDLDFSDIRQYPPASHRGIWVLRPETQSIENTLSARWRWSATNQRPIDSGLWSQDVFVSASDRGACRTRPSSGR
jgi:predicted nuclease of predicted toxin-antitoxin system